MEKEQLLKPEKNNTFCYYPFNQITLKRWNENGELLSTSPCCMMTNDNRNDLIYSDTLKNQTPLEIFNSDKFQELRIDLENGIRNKNCNICWNKEDNNIESHRLNSDGFNENNLVSVDVTLSNLCNLRCRMCQPSNSHSLRKDYMKMKSLNLLNDFRKTTKTYYVSEEEIVLDNTKSYQYKWLLENTDKIKLIRASGGEPFYDKKMLAWLQKFIDNGHSKDTILEFHTNATQFLNQDVIDININFKSVRHIFSIDGVDQTYEIIRHHKFDLLEESIDNFLKKCHNIETIQISLVLSVFNLFNIKKWEEWIKLFFNNIKYRINIDPVYPTQRGISIKRLPVHILEQAKNHSDNIQFRNLIDEAIVNNIENAELLIKEVEILDTVRDQNYNEYLDESIIEWIESYHQTI